MTPRLEDLRREYLQGGLRRADLASDPFSQFNSWFEQVLAADVCDPTAMVLATVDAESQPSQRIVLLKNMDDAGFVFYTNTQSRKGRELANNPRASLLFPWHALERQVKVYGQVEVLSRATAQAYFASRPRESQLAAWASEQSCVIGSRAILTGRFDDATERFGEGAIPVPDHWGGYRVIPHEVEFWQGGAHRLHDCFRYQKTAAGQWQIDRLAP